MFKTMMILPVGATVISCLLATASVAQTFNPLASHPQPEAGQGQEQGKTITITRPTKPAEPAANPGLPSPAPESNQRTINGQITASEQLPNPFTHAVELAGRDGIAFISQNGRFVIRGMVFDMWTGKTLSSLSDIRDSKTSVNLNELGISDEDVDPFVVGTGPAKVTLFVDPLCPYCAQVFDEIAADPSLEDEYTFVIFTVPFLGDDSSRAVTALSCAKDRARAVEALLAHDRRWMQTVDTTGCDLEPIMKRTIMS